jgi:5-methylcytosine-specific restriction protein A
MTRDTGPSVACREIVLERDQFGCIICGQSSMVLHHRRPRAMGGSRRDDTNLPSNLLTVCGPHHDYIESHRTEALAENLLVHQWETPRSHPVLHRLYGWVFLEHDGTVTSAEPDDGDGAA